MRVGGVKLKDISDTSVATYAVMHRRLKTGKDISPGVRNLCVKHVFSVDDQHLTLSEIAARIGKSYNYVYHQLITKGRDTKGLLA